MTPTQVAISAGRLRVVFERAGDRYAHRVEWLDEPKAPIELARSVEGSAAEAWPPSPPLQELHVEQRGAEQAVALCVGRSGRGHWSASFEPDVAAERIRVDIACRAPEPPERLGSRYALPENATGAQLELSALEIAEGAGQWERAALLIQPVAGSWPRTVRWRYVISARS